MMELARCKWDLKPMCEKNITHQTTLLCASVVAMSENNWQIGNGYISDLLHANILETQKRESAACIYMSECLSVPQWCISFVKKKPQNIHLQTCMFYLHVDELAVFSLLLKEALLCFFMSYHHRRSVD